MSRQFGLVVAFLLIAVTGTGAAEDPLVFPEARVEVVDRSRLACDQTGIIASEIPEEGTRIQKDQIVVALQDDIPRAQLASANVLANSNAEIRAKENKAQLAKVEYDRAVLANKMTPGTVSELEVLNLQLAWKQAILEKEQAEVDLEHHQRRRDEADALLNTYRVRAPFSGTVSHVFRNRGEAVRQGDPILELVSVERVRILVEVPLSDRQHIREGLQVTVYPNIEVDQLTRPQIDRDHPLPGKITFVHPVAEDVSRTVWIHIIVDSNTGQLLTPGLSATVVIPKASAGS